MVTALAPTVLAQVAHLSRRAGFGLAPPDLDRLAAGGLAAAIDSYVDYERIPDTLSLAKPKVNDDPSNADIGPLQAWWLDRMIRSARPLEEKMTLFWHGLFATSEDKVDRPTFMYQQNLLLRRLALGDFQALLTAVAIDPAMLWWLDGDGSTKDSPNENFARECMELFSIGIGNYTQHDVREAARAFTGWYIDDHYRRGYSPDAHDGGVKTFLGQTGRWSYQDVTRILANHPACGRFLARKLWTFFAYEAPEESVVAELAGVYRASGRVMREVVRHMFGMPQFYSPRALGGRVKSPVEYAVTAVRELDATVTLTDLEGYLDGMGQSVFFPPNVGGWPSGVRWVNSLTVVGRFAFAEWLLEQHSDARKNRVDMRRLLRTYDAGHWPGTIDRLAAYHLAQPPAPATIDALRRFTGEGVTQDDQALVTLEALLHLLLVSPEYYCA